MAGGILGSPFVMNAKCILFALIQMLLLYTTPPNFSSKIKSYVFLFLVFVIAYVALAWYDVNFGCDIEPLERGQYSITGLFKPNPSSKDSQKSEKCSDYNKIIYFIHILFIAPFIYYIGYNRKNTPTRYFDLLVPLAAFTIVYHVYRYHKVFLTDSLTRGSDT